MAAGSSVVLRIEVHNSFVKLVVVFLDENPEFSLCFQLGCSHALDDPFIILKVFFTALPQALENLVVEGDFRILF